MAGNEVRIVVTARDDASRVLSLVGANAQFLKRNVDVATGGISQAFTVIGPAAGIAAAAIATVGAASVKLASDLNESRNASKETFKDSAGAIEDFANRDADAFNISKRAAFEYAAALGGIFKASGLSTSAAAGMSIQMQKLAADLASFKNLSLDDALTKIEAGLVGEVRPLREVGVLLSDAAVKAQAAKMGFVEVNGELTDGQKVQARAALITAQLADAQGDVARTAGQLANQLRSARQGAEDFGAKVGSAFIPAAEKMLHVLNAVLDVANAIPTPILATALTVGGLGSALVAGTVVAVAAKKSLESLALAYATVANAARAATVAQAAETVATGAGGVAAARGVISTAVSTAAGSALGGAAGAGAAGVSSRFITSGARARFFTGVPAQEIQAAKFAASQAASPLAGAGEAAAGGGTIAVLTRAIGLLALRVNPLGLAFGVLSTAAVGAAFTMQEFANQSRKRLQDQVGRTTGQFAGEVKRAADVTAAGGQPRDILAKLEPQLENLQAARAGLQAGLEATRAGPQNALSLQGASSAEQQIAELDAAIDRLKGTIQNIREPLDRVNAQFAATAEEAMGGGRGADIGGTAADISQKFWEVFKQRMADSADKEAQSAMASQRDAINNAVIDVFKLTGQKAAESFRQSFTPEMLDRVNHRAADLAHTLGIDLVAAMGLAIDEVGAYQTALNGLESERQRKAQELRDTFSNAGDELLGSLSGALGGITPKSEMEALKPGQTELNKIPVLKYDPEGRLIPNLPQPPLPSYDASGRLIPPVPHLNPAPGQAVGIDVVNKLGRGEGTQFPASAFDTSAAKTDPLTEALKAIQARFNKDLAEAFTTGGDAAFNKLAGDQAVIRAEISRTADDLMARLGIKLPEALGLAADAVMSMADAMKSVYDSVNSRFKSDLAEAFVTRGEGAVSTLVAEQARIRAEISTTAERLAEILGIRMPEAMKLAADAILGQLDRTTKTVRAFTAPHLLAGGFTEGVLTQKQAYRLPGEKAASTSLDFSGLQKFDLGGVVGGPRGAPVPILAHAGETVLTTHRDSVKSSMEKVLGSTARTFAPAMLGSGDQTYAPTFAPSYAAAGAGGPPQITITRTVGQIVIQNGDERTVLRALEQADEPVLRDLERQSFLQRRD